MACFSDSGKMPSLNDALHIFASVSARSGSSCCTSHVGAGSRQQCFAGALVTTFIISSAVTSSNADSVVHGRSDITKVGAPVVDWCILGDFVPEEISKVFSCVNIGSGRLCLQQNTDLWPQWFRVMQVGCDRSRPVVHVRLSQRRVQLLGLTFPCLALGVSLISPIDSFKTTRLHWPVGSDDHTMERLVFILYSKLMRNIAAVVVFNDDT